MKKFFAAFLLLSMSLLLSSCFFAFSDQNDAYEDIGDSLVIDLIAFSVEGENDSIDMRYELQIKIKQGENVVDKDELLLNINKKTAMNFVNVAVPSTPDGIARYCFLSEPISNIFEETNRKFGFFTIKRDFELRNPSKINELAPSIYEAFENHVTDINDMEFTFYFAISDNFESNGAARAYKDLYSLSDGASCLFWKSGDISSIKLTYKAMASGWFIVPIILGVITVLVLFAVNKKRKDKGEEPFLDEGSALSQDALDGQITMEEFLDAQKTEENNAD